MRRFPSVGEVVCAVSEAFGVPPDVMMGRSRHVDTVAARSAAVVLLRQFRSMSYPECAAALCMGSHSTAVTTARVWRTARGAEPLNASRMETAIILIERATR